MAEIRDVTEAEAIAIDEDSDRAQRFELAHFTKGIQEIPDHIEMAGSGNMRQMQAVLETLERAVYFRLESFRKRDLSIAERAQEENWKQYRLYAARAKEQIKLLQYHTKGAIEAFLAESPDGA